MRTTTVHRVGHHGAVATTSSEICLKCGHGVSINEEIFNTLILLPHLPRGSGYATQQTRYSKRAACKKPNLALFYENLCNITPRNM